MEDNRSPPTPLPRKNIGGINIKKPVPLPRNKDKHPSSGKLLRSFESVSKQISDNISDKLHGGENYVREVKQTAEDRLERTIKGTKLAKQKIQESVRNSTRNVRSKVTRSFIENKNSPNPKLADQHSSRKEEKTGSNILNVPYQERCVSMPATDIALFDSIQFHSPLTDQNKCNRSDLRYYGNSLSGNSLNSKLSSFNIHHDTLDSDPKMNLSTTTDDVSSSCSSNIRLSINSNLQHTVAEETYDLPRGNSYQQLDPLTGNTFVNATSVEPTSTEVTSADVNLRCLVDDNRNAFVSRHTLVPEISDKQSVDYENWSIKLKEKPLTKPALRPSMSLMFEFDPLSRRDDSADTDPLTIADTNKLPYDFNEGSVSDESDGDFWDNSVSYLSPPTPPERSDSLLTSLCRTDSDVSMRKMKMPNNSQYQTKWFLSSEPDITSIQQTSAESGKQTSVIEKFSNILKIVPESASYLKKKMDQGVNIDIIPSKLVLPSTAVQHRGLMVRFLPGGIDELFKKFPLRTCFFSDHKLTFYQENSAVKEIYNLKNFLSIQIILSHKFNYDGELHCFQVNFSNLGMFNIKRGSVIFGCANESERNVWIRKFVESCTQSFPLKYITDLTRFGWCFLKEGVSGLWDAAWLLLSQRTLHYYNTEDVTVRSLDLRKARCVVLQEAEEGKSDANEGAYLLLDLPDLTLYLRMGAVRETRLWFRILKAVACNNGSSIHHQQLTKDNIPTIVEKCINFIFTQGSLSVGIYRKAGSNSEVSSLLRAFRADAWSVQLAARTHSEHDVANTLKRFFRDLPESLLPPTMHAALCAVTDLPKEQKVEAYKSLIKTLHPISQNTLKRLMGHLHFIKSLFVENCMNATNLATVWGPTLLICPKSTDAKWLQKETEVVYDLIELFISIYEPSEIDIAKESKMLQVLKQCQNVNNPNQKRSGDLHVWIYLKEKQAGNCVNIVLTPGRTSGDVCKELSAKMGQEAHLLVVVEVICNENMFRPLHHDELPFDVVLRWGYWDESDRKDNYLVVKENDLLRETAEIYEKLKRQELVKTPIVLKKDIKFANEKMKSFNPCTVQFTDGCLTCFKEKPSTIILGNWPIDDLRWYIGHESRRNPQCGWSLTFIKKYNKPIRSKEKPWFGCTIAGNCNCKESQLYLIGGLLEAEFRTDMLPTPQLINP